MSSYTLEHVIQDCLREKANVLNTARGKTVDSKIEIYHSAWEALISWIESRLRIHKGAGIGGFATFCWEMNERNGETHCRPLFLVSDAFVKSFRVRRPRIHRIPQLTPIEEVNFSMLAIKFSKTLTKDMIFNAIRDIVRKIGEFIYRGYEMQVDFGFGQLHSKESRVKFNFSQSRLIQILPENATAGVYSATSAPMKYIVDSTPDSEPQEYEEPEYFDPRQSARGTTAAAAAAATSTSSARLLMPSARPPMVPTLTLTKTATPTTEPSPSQPQLTMSSARSDLSDVPWTQTATALDPNQTQTSSADHNAFSASADLQAVLSAIGSKHLKVQKDEWRQQAQDRVLQQAFNRCLDDVERQAVNDEQQRYEAKRQFDDWRNSMRQKTIKTKETMDDLKQFLNKQVEESQERQNQHKLDMKTSLCASILPETAGMMGGGVLSSIIVDGKVVNSRQQISKDLEKQIQHNSQMKIQQRQDSLAKERQFLEQLQIENEFSRAMDRSAHLEKQKALLESWERDCHVRNVKKLQSHGSGLVKEYVDRNLSEPISTIKANALGKSLNMSIGYDPRTGKI